MQASSGVPMAREVSQRAFFNGKDRQINSKRSTNSFRSSATKEIAEAMLKRTTNENDYYKDKKHTFMRGKSEAYSKTTPDCFRILENKNNQNKVENAKNFDGTMTIISRNQGWITVTPKHKNRQKPVEKFGVSGDAAKCNVLSPQWMQSQHPKNKTDQMQRQVPSTTNLRNESFRTFLMDREQPGKSVFSYGDMRHNVHSEEDVKKFNNQAFSQGVKRMTEWPENSSKQHYDKNVTGKIGSYHG